MRARLHTYTAYSIGCGVVWGTILAVVAARDPDRLDEFRKAFVSWASGWLSATIARYIYPPPKARVGESRLKSKAERRG